MAETITRTVITLSNGKRVANFSSPHPFEFEDGSILPAVSTEDSLKYAVTFLEKEYPNGDVELSFDLSFDVQDRMNCWLDIYRNGGANVTWMDPLPTMEWQMTFNCICLLISLYLLTN